MVQISIDTQKDSPETIKKIIEMLHAAIGSSSESTSVSNLDNSFSAQTHSTSAPVSNSNPFDMFNEPGPSQSTSLPTSAPVQQTNSLFDVFGAEDRPNQQTSSSSYQQHVPNQTSDHNSQSSVNAPAGYADNDLFGAFSNDMPSTNFSSQNEAPDMPGLNASFSSAQELLNEDFSILEQDEIEEKPSKENNFFNLDQY